MARLTGPSTRVCFPGLPAADPPLMDQSTRPSHATSDSPGLFVRAGGATVAASALCLLAACRGVDAQAHDIRALHRPDGSIRSVAAVVGGTEFTFGRMGATPRMPAGDWALLAAYSDEPVSGDLLFNPEADVAPKRVRKPQRRSTERLLELSGASDRDPYTAGVKVELAAFLATRSRSKVTREMAVRILGEAARRTETPYVLQTVEDPADPDRVRAALETLADAIDGEGDVTASAEALGAMPLELDDWRRVLRATTALRQVIPQRQWADEGLADLHLEAQSNCAAFGLGRALRDPSEWVAGAATEETLSFDRSRSFEIFRDSLDALSYSIARAVLDSVIEHGLPESDPPKEVWLEYLVRAALTLQDNQSLEDDQLRVRAFRALGLVSDAGFESLRPEDWTRWYVRFAGVILDDSFSSELGGGPQ